MKRIIDGKLYNTETAECVASYSCDEGSFDYVMESLYIKKTGQWFLYGEGGPRSMYSRPCENNWTSGGSTIMPYTEKEARQWLAGHDFVDEYITYFGEPEE